MAARECDSVGDILTNFPLKWVKSPMTLDKENPV